MHNGENQSSATIKNIIIFTFRKIKSDPTPTLNKL